MLTGLPWSGFWKCFCPRLDCPIITRAKNIILVDLPGTPRASPPCRGSGPLLLVLYLSAYVACFAKYIPKEKQRKLRYNYVGCICKVHPSLLSLPLPNAWPCWPASLKSKLCLQMLSTFPNEVPWKSLLSWISLTPWILMSCIFFLRSKERKWFVEKVWGDGDNSENSEKRPLLCLPAVDFPQVQVLYPADGHNGLVQQPVLLRIRRHALILSHVFIQRD